VSHNSNLSLILVKRQLSLGTPYINADTYALYQLMAMMISKLLY